MLGFWLNRTKKPLVFIWVKRGFSTKKDLNLQPYQRTNLFLTYNYKTFTLGRINRNKRKLTRVDIPTYYSRIVDLNK